MGPPSMNDTSIRIQRGKVEAEGSALPPLPSKSRAYRFYSMPRLGAPKIDSPYQGALHRADERNTYSSALSSSSDNSASSPVISNTNG